ARLQRFVSETLKLTHQVVEIDYWAKNFIHADVSLEELEEAFGRKLKQYTTYEIALRVIDDMRGHDPDGRSSWQQILDMLLGARDVILDREAEGHTVKLRRIFGRQLAKSAGALPELRDLNDVLIDFRNPRVMNVLGRRVGFGERYIGIFFG